MVRLWKESKATATADCDGYQDLHIYEPRRAAAMVARVSAARHERRDTSVDCQRGAARAVQCGHSAGLGRRRAGRDPTAGGPGPPRGGRPRGEGTREPAAR